MRLLRAIICVLLPLIACQGDVNITAEAIKIKWIKSHPFLVDHDRELQVLSSSGSVIDKLKIYGDAGAGCNAYLYEADSAFIVIDCNGQWFSIGRHTGTITKERWEWEKQPPPKLIGRYSREYSDGFYKLERDLKVSLSTIYQYKDPGD